MTRNFPEYVRGHFREGEILCAMGNYEEAYKCFCRVILLDPSCVEAMNELSEVQILILCKKGFSRYQAGCALKRSKDLEEAENILKAGAIPKESDYYFSDDEDSVTIVTANSNTIDPREDPSNPKRCCSLWIGNVTQKMTDSQLASFFKKFGEVKSVSYCGKMHCAFVNYLHPDSASKAMRALQGCDLAGNKKVLLRWPNKDLGL